MASTPRQSLGTHGQANLFPFPNVAALAPALRAYVINCQNAGIQRHGSFKVAVSGGSLPKTLAQALLVPATGEADTIKWDKWEIFFADERVVPLDHADSNYALLKAELLDKLPATGAKPNVYPINKDKLNEEALEVADDYEQLLVSSFASRDSVRLPIFDLLLLGCGPDGHTCSLFPGHELLREATAWVAPIEDSPKPPPKRITLTLPVVTHAVRVAFVATGGGKKGIMKQIFEEGAASGLPCALVNENTGDRCSWFVDDAAVEGVGYPKRATAKSAHDAASTYTGEENSIPVKARIRSLILDGTQSERELTDQPNLSRLVVELD